MVQYASPRGHADNNSSKLVHQWLLRKSAADNQDSKSCSHQIWHLGLKSLDTREGNRDLPHCGQHCYLIFDSISGLLDSCFFLWEWEFLIVMRSFLAFGLPRKGSQVTSHIPWEYWQFFLKNWEDCYVWTKEQSWVRLLWFVIMINLGAGSSYDQIPDVTLRLLK